MRRDPGVAPMARMESGAFFQQTRLGPCLPAMFKTRMIRAMSPHIQAKGQCTGHTLLLGTDLKERQAKVNRV